MSNDPPAADLGASRDRLEALAESMDWRGHDPEMARAIRALLAAYDAQATRLANAAEAAKAVDALVRDHDAQAARLAAVEQLVGRMQTRLECSSDPYSRGHAAWLETMIAGAVGAGEAS